MRSLIAIQRRLHRAQHKKRILLAICVYRTLFVNRSTGPSGRYVFKSRERIMRTGELLVRRLVLGLAAVACGLLPGIPAAEASDNKLALIPGGPHPYFAPWEQAAADAAKDFGIAAVEYKVPSEWKLEAQTELLESLAAQGTNGFGVFPGDAVGVNAI